MNWCPPFEDDLSDWDRPEVARSGCLGGSWKVTAVLAVAVIVLAFMGWW